MSTYHIARLIINYLCINYTIIYYEAMRPPKSYFLSEGCVDHTMSNHVTVTCFGKFSFLDKLKKLIVKLCYPLAKLRTQFTGLMAKSTSPGLLDTIFFVAT